MNATPPKGFLYSHTVKNDDCVGSHADPILVRLVMLTWFGSGREEQGDFSLNWSRERYPVPRSHAFFALCASER